MGIFTKDSREGITIGMNDREAKVVIKPTVIIQMKKVVSEEEYNKTLKDLQNKLGWCNVVLLTFDMECKGIIQHPPLEA